MKVEESPLAREALDALTKAEIPLLEVTLDKGENVAAVKAAFLICARLRSISPTITPSDDEKRLTISWELPAANGSAAPTQTATPREGKPCAECGKLVGRRMKGTDNKMYCAEHGPAHGAVDGLAAYREQRAARN